ncbi:MAG: 1-hydroxycarotenoid 3,4-desaturase CrtD [Cryomorphaceae bacterium]
MHTVIIGSGIAALAAAIRLRAKGMHVSVYEANEVAGGKLHSFQLGDYRFDGGPSLFTMPQFIDELYELAGRDPRAHFNYIPCTEACRYFWEDGKQIHAHSNPTLFAAEAERVFGFPSEELLDYFDHIKNIYDRSGKIFLERSLHTAATWLSKDTLHALMDIRKYDLFRSMHQANSIRIGEPHLVQLFDRFATYNGSNPYKAPGILNVIPWLEHGFGTFFPSGGMAEIPRALVKLGREMGIKYHFEKRVERIRTERGKAVGIEVDGHVVMADTVISNMDVYYTYRYLLPEQPAPERILNQERSSSAMVFYWGIQASFDEIGLHNIFFSDDYKQEFSQLFEGKVMATDPTVYVNVSSKLEPTDAPNGCENWFVMVNAPADEGQDWEGQATKVRAIVLNKLSRRLGREIAPLIKEERIWDPKGIEEDTLSYKGALYGNSSNDRFAAFLRHPNMSNRIQGLYFCGGSVHPGGGIPLALLSAKITAELVNGKNGK